MNKPPDNTKDSSSPSLDVGATLGGVPELDLIIGLIDSVERRISKDLPINVTDLPDYVEKMCNALASLPVSEVSAARQVLDQVYIWLENLEQVIRDNEPVLGDNEK